MNDNNLASKKEFIAFICLAIVMGLIVYLQRHKKYSLYEDIQHRIELDFNKSEAEVKEYIKQYIPNVTDEQIAEWEESHALECMDFDGEKRYFRNAAPNLFRIDPICREIKQNIDLAKSGNSEIYSRLSNTEKDDSVNILNVINTVTSQRHNLKVADKTNGQIEIANDDSNIAIGQRFRVKYTLTVNADAVPDGEIIRCWLPYPRSDVKRQQNVRFIGANSDNYIFSPEEYQHSTLYMEKAAITGEPTVFSEEFEYESFGEWHFLLPKQEEDDIKRINSLYYQIAEVVPDKYNTKTKLYKKYTSQRNRHIVFSDRMKSLADSLTKGIINPYLQAKAIFTWINNNFPWASAREYSTIENIPEYVVENGHGDCGQVSLLFITLCRIKGIPARFQSGFMMHPSGWNLHDWAEVYFENIGWVPVDQSFGIPPYSKNGSTEEYFFLGGIDSYRMIVNNDFGLDLYPKKNHTRSETVDFQRGEVEWRDGNLYFPDWSYSMEIQYLN